MQIIDFLVAINGVGQLWGADGQFLGLISSNQNDLNSIINPYGIYGSQNGLYSITNPNGIYGGQQGLYSPYSSYCLNPPAIFYNGQAMLVVSKNNYIQTNELFVIDPDLLIGVYLEIAKTTRPVNLLQAHLEALAHSRQTQAQIISQAMQTTAQMFY